MSTQGLLQSVSLSTHPTVGARGCRSRAARGECSNAKAGAHVAWAWWHTVAGHSWVCLQLGATSRDAQRRSCGWQAQGVAVGASGHCALCYLLSEESIAGIPAVPQCLCPGPGAHTHSRQHWETPCPRPRVLAALLPPHSREGTGSVHAAPGQRGPLQQCICPPACLVPCRGSWGTAGMGHGCRSGWDGASGDTGCVPTPGGGDTSCTGTVPRRRSSTALARHFPVLGKSKTPVYWGCCGPPPIRPPGLRLCLAASSLGPLGWLAMPSWLSVPFLHCCPLKLFPHSFFFCTNTSASDSSQRGPGLEMCRRACAGACPPARRSPADASHVGRGPLLLALPAAP